jgi:hypothetical protein
MEPTGMILAVAASRDHVLSARPDAPVVPTPPPRLGHTDTARRATAALLRHLADRVEPHAARPCQAAIS